jgi:hypothetical protein
LSAGVLGGHFLVGRAHQFFVDGMAGHAVLGSRQCLIGKSGGGGNRAAVITNKAVSSDFLEG